MADHEGAHEGQRDKDTRAVWTNPEAPEYLPLEGAAALEGSAEEFEQARAARLATLPVPEEPAPKTPQTHCMACGAEHDQKLDPTLRTEFGMPLAAWRDQEQEADRRFAWPKVCRDCGAVYCPIWKTL